jgi:PAS domain S-box-containing protein
MKKQTKPAPRKEKRAGRNGVERDSNGRRERASSARVLRQPKSELESAIQRYVDLYDFAPIAYVSFDRAGRIEEANLAATELVSERRDLLIGRPFAFYVADLDSFLKHLLYCRTSQQEVKTELLLKSRKGEQIPAVLLSTPITSTTKNGAMLYQTAIIDLRERKAQEQALAEQARLLDLSNDAIIVRDAEDRITYWNKGAEIIYGYPREEALGQVTHTLLKTEHPERLSKIVEKLLRDNYWEGELVHVRRDGKRLTVFSRWSLDRDPHGNRAFILETNNDITQRKHVEERLELVSRLPTENPAPVLRLKQDKVISFANPAAKRLLKKFGVRVGDVVPAKIAKAASTHKRTTVEMSLYGRSYEILVAPVAGEDVNLYFNDITGRKKAEAALQKSKEMLEKLVQQRTIALRGANKELENEIRRRKGLEGQILEISDREQERLGQELHDGLCQQLTAIAFMARAAALRLKDHRVADPSELEKIAQLINNSVMDARGIAHDLHKEEIGAAEFKNALLNLAERKIWKTPCRFRCDGELNIEDDKVASELFRIVREGVINANKHAEASEIVLEARHRKRELVFSVTDNGIGFNGQTKHRGLGFHIMQYRAQSIGARLELESPRRGGTRLSVHLPIEK